ncbi:MAG: O-antigen ligase family protein [Candidatus Omnitrophica bacterium]|nr:O-antigen ligase family protein [Candidatus Omnitrophota bacterium]
MSDRVVKGEVVLEKVTFYTLLVFWASSAFSPALIEISFSIAFGCWLLNKFLHRSVLPRISKWGIFWPLIGFVLICILSYFGSSYPGLSYRGIFKVLQQVMLFWMVADVFCAQKALNQFEKVFMALFAVMVIDGFVQYLFGHDFLRGYAPEESSAGLRISASFKSYGLLGAYLIMTIPVMASLAVDNIKKKKSKAATAFFGILVILGLVLLFMTRSRGCLLAFIIGLLAALILAKQWKWLTVIGALALAGFWVLPKGMIIHLDAEGKEQSLVERYYLWDRAIHVIQAAPLGGTGINTYAMAHGKYDKTRNKRVIGYYAHNGYLQMAAETGIPSLLLFLLFLILYFSKALKGVLSRGHAKWFGVTTLRFGLLVGLFNFLIMALIDTVLHNPQPVMQFWFLMGIQWAYQNMASASEP